MTAPHATPSSVWVLAGFGRARQRHRMKLSGMLALPLVALTALGIEACAMSAEHEDTGDGVAALSPSTQKMVVGYLPGYATNAARKYSIDDLPGFPTHVIYGFAGLQDNGTQPATVVTPEPKDPTKNFQKLAGYRARFPATKLMISIGGWNHSHIDGGPGSTDPTPLFAKVASDPVWRKAFVASAMDTFIRRTPRLFDGIDIDWEFPSTPADKASFTLLAREFRAQLDAQGAADGKHYLLSVAVSINPNELELPAVAALSDFVNVMAYNFHGARSPGGSDVTNFENALDSVAGDPTPTLNDKKVVSDLLAAGLPASKLVLGITSYAHTYAGVSSTNDGLFQSYAGPGPGSFGHPGILTYKDVMTTYAPKCTPHVAGAWHSSWLYCASDKVFISYESTEEVREKTVFANQQRLGGMMLWEIGADDDAALLRTANKTLNGGCAVGEPSPGCGTSVCNDGMCMADIATSCANPSKPVCHDDCAAHGGKDPHLGCKQQP